MTGHGRPTGQRLHICDVVQEWLPGQLNGIARLIHARATGLAERGHTVRVLTRSSEAHRVDLEDGVWIHRVPTRQHVRPAGLTLPQGLWNHSASILDELRAIETSRAVDVVDVPNWDVEGLATILDGSFVTVLGLYTSLASYVAVDARFAEHDPTVRDVLDAERLCYERADAFLAASTAIVDEVEQAFGLSLPRDRLGLVPHGLPDVDRFEPCSRRADGSLDVLFVGRLEPRKGIDTFLDALPLIAGAVPHSRFTIVGDDAIVAPSGRTFREDFEKSEVGGRMAHVVEFAGVVDEEELAHRYAACDVFVAPSRFESFGLILVEAMRAGKPVVACDASGMREVIGDSGAGVLIPPGDRDALARAVIDLLRDAARRRSVGAAGRRRFEERFTRERMIDGVEAFLDRLVDGTKTVRPGATT